MRNLTFFVEGQPVGYSRSAARLGFTPADVTAWRDAIRWGFKAAVGGKHVQPQAFAGRVAVELVARGTKGDADNVAKEAMDALKGLAFADDGQVVSLRLDFPERTLGPKGGVKKPREEAPGLEVTITWLDWAVSA